MTNAVDPGPRPEERTKDKGKRTKRKVRLLPQSGRPQVAPRRGAYTYRESPVGAWNSA